MGCTISDHVTIEESQNNYDFTNAHFDTQHQNQEHKLPLSFSDHKMNARRRSSWLDDEVCWQMSNQQIHCVKETWKLMEHHQDEIGKIVTDRLLKTDKELAFVFQVTLSAANNEKELISEQQSNSSTLRSQTHLLPQKEIISRNKRRNSVAVNNRFLSPNSPNKDLIARRRSFETNDTLLNKEIPETQYLDKIMLYRHTNSVLQALGAAVDCLDECLALNRILLALGRAHQEFELLKSEHYFRLWDSLDFAFRQHLGALYSKEVCQSWKIVFKYLARKMCEGASLPPRGDPLAPRWCRVLEEDEDRDEHDFEVKECTDEAN